MDRDFSWKRNWVGYALVAPAMVAIILVAIYPMIYGVILSFFSYDLLNPERHFILFQNYKDVFGQADFRKALVNTVVWTVANVTFQLIIATIVALVLNGNIKSRSFFRTSILVPWAIPSVIAVLAFRFLYDSKLGLINIVLQALNITHEPISWLGNLHTAMPAVIIESIWKGMPFVLIFILASLQTIPAELYESSSMDGAGRFKEFFYVTLPMIKETVGIAAILTTIGTINNFNTIWLLTKGGPLGSTDILFTLAYRIGFVKYNFGTASAVSVIIFIIIALLTKLYASLSESKED